MNTFGALLCTGVGIFFIFTNRPLVALIFLIPGGIWGLYNLNKSR